MLKEALELHANLNPALWDKNQNLLPEVDDRLHKIVNKFQSECMLPLDIVDVHLVGSNASFNYTSHSDLDVHIVVNFSLVDCDKEILMTAYNLQKSKFNAEYDISIRGIEIELYIEDIESNTMSNGIYSLYEKRWIKKPQPIQVPDIDVSSQVNQLADKCERILDGDDGIAITKFINMLYMMRKNGLATDGEFAVGNLLFKELRNMGYLDALKDKLKEIQSEELTLEQINEDALLEIGNPKSIRNGSRRKISSYPGATISPSPGSIVTHHITPLRAGGPTAWNNLFSISGHDFAEAEGVHKLLEYDAKRHLPFNPPYANTYSLEGFTYDPAGNITGKYDIDVDLRIH